MDKERVEQIVESRGYIEVTYRDNPVWIENINRDGKAQVKDMRTNELREVSFAELQETDDMSATGG
jgi:small acid-soluble spore protein H (minor)